MGDAFARAGLAIDARAEAAFDRFVALLLKWNAKINLTSVRDEAGIVETHLVDSAFVAEGVVAGDRVVDVGSGAGLPGIVIAVLVPEAKITLVEPNAKKVAFLRAAVEETGATNAEVRRARDTDLEAAAWDRAVSRATLEPIAWLAAGARLVRAGGEVAVMVADESNLPAPPEGITRGDVRRSVMASGAKRTVGWYRKG